VSSATCILSDRFMAPSRKARVLSAAWVYASLVGPYASRSSASPLSSTAANAKSSVLSKKEERECISKKNSSTEACEGKNFVEPPKTEE